MNKAPWPLALAALVGVGALVVAGGYGLSGLSSKPAGEGVAAYAVGELADLVVRPDPPAQPATVFQDGDGADTTLADFQGKPVLVNLWATWCAPCVAELPALDNLHARHGGEDFAVVAIAFDRDPEDARTFYEQNGIDALDLYADPTMRLVAELQTPGLPTTILYDAEGRELARLTKDAVWDGHDADALVDYVTGAR